MIFGDVMIIARSVVHEVNAEGRTLPRDTDGQLEPFENTLQAILEHLTQPFDMVVNGEFWRSQLLERGDCSSGGERRGVERAGNQDALGFVRMDKIIHVKTFACYNAHRIRSEERRVGKE